MFRTLSAILTVVAGALLVPATPAAPPAGLKLGEEFKGKIGGQAQIGFPLGTNLKRADRGPEFIPNAFGPMLWQKAYTSEVPVTLKEGQAIDISVTVTGVDRRVFVKLLDPAGKQIANSDDVPVKTVRLAVEEVAASGKYTIVVASDQIGGFTLRAKSGSEGEDDVEKLKEKIKQREEELAELKAKLKALEGKRSNLRNKDPE
jgi:hypothetical protein